MRADGPVPPGFYPCPLCVVQVQRASKGTLQDGLAAHYETVHPGYVVPPIRASPPQLGAS